MFARSQLGTVVALVAVGVGAPSLALAEDKSDEWKWQGTLYLWGASIEGSAELPVVGGSANFGLDFDQILDNLNFAAMAYVSVHKGRWGFGADVIYLDIGDSVSRTRDVTIDGGGLPGAVTANLDLDQRSWIVTFGPQYRIEDSEVSTFDVVAGVRMLDLEVDLNWSINGSIAGLPLPGQSGNAGGGNTFWSWVVGAGGERRFGDDNRWFIPYYADVGGGGVDYTWQALLGLGYRWDWGAVLGVYRYLDFHMKDNDAIENLSVNGPAIGVSWTF